jgi:hypothetical protein
VDCSDVTVQTSVPGDDRSSPRTLPIRSTQPHAVDLPIQMNIIRIAG